MAVPWRQWLAVFAGLLVVYLLTAKLFPPLGWDNIGAWVPAHWFATHGSFRLDGYASSGGEYAGIPWFVEGAGGHLVTNRQPGIVFAAVPFALVIRGDSGILGGFTAAVWSAAGMATLSLVFRRMMQLRVALGATVLTAFGTSIWSVSAHELWPHSVDTLLLPLAVLSLATARYGRTGVAFGASILVRAHLAAAAVVVGAWEAVRRRSWRPLFSVGVPSAIGLGLLVLWNRYYFGAWSIVGGGAYSDYVVQNLVKTPIGSVHGGDHVAQHWYGLGYLVRYVGMLFSPARGLIPGSPFLLLLLPGLRAGWRVAPHWARTAAVAGLAYLLIQQQINTFSGSGTGFYSYRYPIEALLLAAPLLASAYVAWVRPHPWRVRAFRVLAAASVCSQAAGVLFYNHVHTSYSPWHEWPFEEVVTSTVARGVVICTVMLAAMVVAALLPVRSEGSASATESDGEALRSAKPDAAY